MPHEPAPLHVNVARLILGIVLVLACAGLGYGLHQGRELRTQNRELVRIVRRLNSTAANLKVAQAELRAQAVARRAELVSGCGRGNVQRAVVRGIIQGDIDAAALVAETSTSPALRAYYRGVRLPALRKALALPAIAEQDCDRLFR